MKEIIRALTMLPLIAFSACHSGEETKHETVRPTRQFAKPVNKFSGVVFASKKDTSCGMPLSTGLEDTVHLNGKVYGFCSKECKDNFVKTLQTEHKR